MLEIGPEGKVERFVEKPQLDGWASAGFFVFDRRFAVSGAQQPEVFAEALRQAWDTAAK